MPIILFILAGTVHCNTSWLTGPPLLLQTAALEVFPLGPSWCWHLFFASVDGCENGYSNLHYPQEMPDIVGDLLTYRYVPSSGKIYLSYYLQVNVISVSLGCTLCYVPISKLVSIVIHLILLLPLTLRTKLSCVLSLTLRSLRRLVLATNLFPFFCFSSQAECEKKEHVKSPCSFPAKLSGCVWQGCDAVRSHWRSGYRCYPPHPDWCTVSAPRLGSQFWCCHSGVFSLFTTILHPSPFIDI